MDGSIDINDCGYIQDYTSGIEGINNVQYYLADFDKNGAVNVRDALALQLFVAGIH